ncbi:MAG: ribosomal protein L7/L12 [Planctomycetaceae bacterium]|nr:ribosomal protein L7/L12 [Planctomycetaceae bacterium]
MDETLEREIQQLLQSGQKIEAVKRVRESTGMGLAEAKAAVEAIQEGRTPTLPVRADVDLEEVERQVVGLLERGSAMEAIKVYRQQTNVGLKDARDAVEQLAGKHGIPISLKPGCLGVLLLAALVTGGLVTASFTAT